MSVWCLAFFNHLLRLRKMGSEIGKVGLPSRHKLAALIAQTERWSRQYIDLMRLRLRLVTTMTAANLGEKLRLTVQASTDRRTPKLAPAPGRKPWDFDPEPPGAA
jgi:hypothetical protein